MSHMAFTGTITRIEAGDYRAEVAEVGAALAGLWHRDDAVTVEIPAQELPPKSTGSVLMPWPNRIRDGHYSFDGTDYQLALTEPAQRNASHGFAKWARWNVAERADTAVTMAWDLVPQTGYPFEVRLEITYSVTAGTGLSVAVRASNTGASAAPFGAGFHPYFDVGDEDLDSVQLLIPAATVLDTDERQIPVGRTDVTGTPFDLRQLRPIRSLRLDQGYADLVAGTAVVRSARHRAELRWDASFGYLQVFTPPFVTPGRNAVAIEPMSCPANAFNSGEGLVRLEPGHTWSGEWGIRVVD